MPEIRTPITTPTNFITTTGPDADSNIGHSTLAEVRAALGIASGFTYDQQAEPSAPTAGETWRERTAGGLIVGDWEWSGSLWLNLSRDLIQTDCNSQQLITLNAASTPTVVGFIPRTPTLLESVQITFYNQNFFQNQNADNHVVLTVQRLHSTGTHINFNPTITYNTWTGAGAIGNVAHTEAATGHYSVNININQLVGANSPPVVNQFRGVRFQSTTIVGTPTATDFRILSYTLMARRSR